MVITKPLKELKMNKMTLHLTISSLKIIDPMSAAAFVSALMKNNGFEGSVFPGYSSTKLLTGKDKGRLVYEPCLRIEIYHQSEESVREVLWPLLKRKWNLKCGCIFTTDSRKEHCIENLKECEFRE